MRTSWEIKKLERLALEGLRSQLHVVLVIDRQFGSGGYVFESC